MENEKGRKPKYEKPVAVDLKTTTVNGGVIDYQCPGGDGDIPTTCLKGSGVLPGG